MRAMSLPLRAPPLIATKRSAGGRTCSALRAMTPRSLHVGGRGLGAGRGGPGHHPRHRHSAAIPAPRKGVRLHRVTRLAPADIAIESNIRVTTPARSLIDFAAHASSSELPRRSATHARSTGSRIVRSRRPWSPTPRPPLARRPCARCSAPVKPTTARRPSAIMRDLCQRAELPQPLVNASAATASSSTSSGQTRS